MPVWMHRAGGIEIMKAREKARKIETKLERRIKMNEPTKAVRTVEVPELADLIKQCPIITPDTTRRHMQAVIVWAFYNYPNLTNDELTDLINRTFPESTWNNDPDGRANADRNKFNAGNFRCMGGWHPEKGDEHYAEVPNESA